MMQMVCGPVQSYRNTRESIRKKSKKTLIGTQYYFLFVFIDLQCRCEILIAEAKKVLLIIIWKRKNLINVYFPHTLTYATTKLVSSTDLVSIYIAYNWQR